jgi:hypothetical protein
MSKLSAWLVVSCVVGSLTGCGGRSSLDEYEDGIPSVVPLTGSGRRPATSDAGPATDSGADSDAEAPGDGDGDTPGGGAIGDACHPTDAPCAGAQSQCLERLSLGGFITIPFEGGYCTQPGCSRNADCPEGSACFRGIGAPACLKLCESNSDCRADDGYTCAAIPFLGEANTTYCLPPLDLGGFSGFGGLGG